MSIYSNVTEKDLDNLRKLSQQQKELTSIKIKNRILKQTHDDKLAEGLSPITKKLNEINTTTQESLSPITKQIVKLEKKSEVTDGNTQTSAIENKTTSRSLFDTLAFMKTSKNFFKLIEDDVGNVFWNEVLIKPLGGNKISIKDKEYNISPDIQAYFTNTKLTTEFLDDIEKETVYDILKSVGFYDVIPRVGLKAARMQDALYKLLIAIDEIRYPSLPTIENIESSSDLEGQGIKIITPSNIDDIYSRLEVLLGLKLSGHSDTLSEASNLIDELYKRGEIQTTQQYRNALNKFSN